VFEAVRYLKWTRDDGETDPDIAEVWTEVDDEGSVTRELAFNERGEVVHRCRRSSSTTVHMAYSISP
jgi:hypothetical protein